GDRSQIPASSTGGRACPRLDRPDNKNALFKIEKSSHGRHSRAPWNRCCIGWGASGLREQPVSGYVRLKIFHFVKGRDPQAEVSIFGHESPFMDASAYKGSYGFRLRC